MRRRPSACRLALGLLCWSGAGAAAPSLNLMPEATRTVELRQAGEKRYWVNRAECRADDELTFAVHLTEWEGTTLQAWAGPSGVDCGDAAERAGGAARCWRVAEAAADGPTRGLVVRVQDLIARHLPGSPAEGPGSGDATACEPADDADHAVSLHFFVLDPQGLVPTGFQPPTFASGWDLEGPAAPATVAVTAGDARLTVEFDASSSADTVEHALYLAAAVGEDPCTAAGAVAGVHPDGLVPTVVVPAPGTRATLAGLTNGEAQAVLVAGFDEVDNPGLLSVAACGTPLDSTDFFEAYRAAGGQGGGGCGLAPGRPYAPAGALLLALGALARLTRGGARSRARPGRTR